VLYPLSVNESYSTESKTVGVKVTALKCEIEGIALGLEVALQYYLQLKCSFNIAQYLYILCDCSEAIVSVSKSKATLHRRITSLCKQLCDLNVICCLAWIPSHAGIIGNEMADDLARSLAYDVFRELMLQRMFHFPLLSTC